MQEFSSVTASSYDADALAPLLSAKSAEGWDVISIVSAGTNIVAYLSREATGEDTGEIEAPAYLEAVDAPETAAPDRGRSRSDRARRSRDRGGGDRRGRHRGRSGRGDRRDRSGRAGDRGRRYRPIRPRSPQPPFADTAADNAVDEPAGWAAVPEETPAAPVEETSVEDLAAQVTEPEPEPVVAEPAAQEPAPVESTVPAGWYADPSGRYELRYWDGSAWTEHVSRAGQQFTDPPVA